MPRPTPKRIQKAWWIFTFPQHEFTPYLHPDSNFCTGQLELGEGGFLHWQVTINFKRSQDLAWCRKNFGNFHAEPCMDPDASIAYCSKEETRIQGTHFSLGKKPFQRGSKRDWAEVYELAKQGSLEEIDPSILVPNYGAIKRIYQDNLKPVAIERTIHVFWGRTGTGKSRRAWSEAGLDAYPKNARTKFWDGYRNQEHVVMDEFRGAIDIGNILTWFDRYPVIVEVKGSSICLVATTMWITSNLHPNDWYPQLDNETRAALLRRLNIVHFE